MTQKQLSDSTRNRVHISRRITDTNIPITGPLLDRLVDLVASVPGKHGNSHQHIALTAVVDLVTRKQGIDELDISDLRKTFEEGTIFLRKRSWLYRNRDLIATRLRAAGGGSMHPLVIEYLTDLVLKSPFGKDKPNPHNTLTVIEKALQALKDASVEFRLEVIISTWSGTPADRRRTLYVWSVEIPNRSYAAFRSAIDHAIDRELHPDLSLYCGAQA